MTRLLASVNSLDEAQLVWQAGVDIIDLKQPALGALGALPLATVEKIRAWRPPGTPLSATVGDLPMQAEVVGRAARAMAATGVDYVKIGFFPGGDWLGVVDELSVLAGGGAKLIAVLFADARPDPTFIATLQQGGFTGVMLDTMDKSRGSLRQVLTPGALEAFVAEARRRGLLCGLAGSLRLEDIPELLGYRPDYLGFRGALCAHRQRTAELDPAAVARIKQALRGDVVSTAV